MTVVFKSKFSEIDSEVDKCKIGLEKQYFSITSGIFVFTKIPFSDKSLSKYTFY